MFWGVGSPDRIYRIERIDRIDIATAVDFINSMTDRDTRRQIP
jgi:hypothetical protein